MESASFETDNCFENAHTVFREKSNEVVKDIALLDLYLPVAIRRILKDRQQGLPFNVLSIGCGNGAIDQCIIKIVNKELEYHEQGKNTNIFNRAIDPNGHSIELYRERVQKARSGGEQTLFDVRQMSFEEYKEKQEGSLTEGEKDDPVKFDIIHFIHSLYSINIEEALVYCFERELNANGQVICIISDYIMSNVVSKLGDRIKQYGKATSDERYVEIIMKIAENQGWKVDHYTEEHFIDFTDMFDENSVEGNLLFDFMTQTKNFRATTGKEKVQEVLQAIQGISTVQNGKIIGKKVDDLLIIYH